MAKSKTIELSFPVEWHKEKVDSVDIREPTGGDYLDLGDPRKVVQRIDGSVLWEENNAVIKSYLERCVIVKQGGGPAFVRILDLADARKLKLELFGFFTDTSAQETSSDS